MKIQGAFFTESNSITYETTPSGHLWLEVEGNYRRARDAAVRFEAEDLPSLIKFLEQVIADLKKENK